MELTENKILSRQLQVELSAYESVHNRVLTVIIMISTYLFTKYTVAFLQFVALLVCILGQTNLAIKHFPGGRLANR